MFIVIKCIALIQTVFYYLYSLRTKSTLYACNEWVIIQKPFSKWQQTPLPVLFPSLKGHYPWHITALFVFITSLSLPFVIYQAYFLSNTLSLPQIYFQNWYKLSLLCSFFLHKVTTFSISPAFSTHIAAPSLTFVIHQVSFRPTRYLSGATTLLCLGVGCVWVQSRTGAMS